MFFSMSDGGPSSLTPYRLYNERETLPHLSHQDIKDQLKKERCSMVLAIWFFFRCFWVSHIFLAGLESATYPKVKPWASGPLTMMAIQACATPACFMWCWGPLWEFLSTCHKGVQQFSTWGSKDPCTGVTYQIQFRTAAKSQLWSNTKSNFMVGITTNWGTVFKVWKH